MTSPTISPLPGQVRTPALMRDCLLLAGIASSLVYVGGDVFAATHWAGYSYTAQSYSEPLAIGAPTRPFVFLLSFVYNALVVSFGFGVMMPPIRREAQRMSGILLVTYGAVSFTGPFTPMHMRGVQLSFADTMHIAVTMLLVLLMLLFIGFGAASRPGWFRAYSIGTIVLLVIFGSLAGAQGKRIAADLPTPWLGLEERVNIYASMVWVVVFALRLLRAARNQSTKVAANSDGD